MVCNLWHVAVAVESYKWCEWYILIIHYIHSQSFSRIDTLCWEILKPYIFIIHLTHQQISAFDTFLSDLECQYIKVLNCLYLIYYVIHLFILSEWFHFVRRNDVVFDAQHNMCCATFNFTISGPYISFSFHIYINGVLYHWLD